MARMSQLIVAVQDYELAHEVYPPGVTDDAGPVKNQPAGFHHSWTVDLLPYVDEKVIAARVATAGVYHEKNAQVRGMVIAAYTCPSAVIPPDIGISDYAAVHHDGESPIDDDNNGVFFLNSEIRQGDVFDGAAHTLFLGEKRSDEDADLGWMSGTRATLRNTGTRINRTDVGAPAATAESDDKTVGGDEPPQEDPFGGGSRRIQPDKPAVVDPLLYVGGFGSEHTGGVVFAFGDGHVQFIANEIDMKTYRQLGHRADGELIDIRKLD